MIDQHADDVFACRKFRVASVELKRNVSFHASDKLRVCRARINHRCKNQGHEQRNQVMPFDSVLAFLRVADFFSKHIDFSSIQIVTNGLNASSDATGMATGPPNGNSPQILENKGRPKIRTHSPMPSGWTRCPYLDT
jgi:hypothetical protein